MSSTNSGDGRRTASAAGRLPLTVCYDADCRMCSASADLLRRVDRVGRLRLVPLQVAADDISTVRDAAASSDLSSGLHVVSADGTVAVGAEAVLRICDALTPLRPLAWLRRLPLVQGSVERLYSLVAAHRYRITPRARRACRQPRDPS